MNVRRIAFRNLNRQKRRSILLGGALAFGIGILVTVNGIAGGIVRSLERNFSEIAVGQIFFTGVEKGPKGQLVYSVKDDSYLLGRIAELGIVPTYVARRTLAMGLLVANGEGVERELSGVDWKSETQLERSLRLVAGSLDGMGGSPGIVLSSGMAEKLRLVPKKEPDAETEASWAGLDKAGRADRRRAYDRTRAEALAKTVGETVLVELKTLNGQQNLGEFRVRAVYEAQYDLDAYVDRDLLDALLDMPAGTYNQFGMFIRDYRRLDADTARIYEAIKGHYDMLDLEKVRGRSLQTVAAELRRQSLGGPKYIITNINNEIASIKGIFSIVQAVSFGFFVVLLLVIMVGITNTFRIVVWERTREIGTMRALGMQRSEVRAVFLWEALFLSLGGALAGLIFGGLVLLVLGSLRWNLMTELSFFMSRNHLLVSVDPLLVLGTLAIVSILSLLAALVPARRAARLEPALALRTNY